MPSTALRILVVDDERDMRFLTKAFLEHAFPGVQVSEAVDGPAALALLAKQPFDVVVSDHRMPGMDGFTLLTRVPRAVPPARRILMTAYADKTLQERARAAGFLFVEKAGDPENIVEAVRQALGQPPRVSVKSPPA